MRPTRRGWKSATYRLICCTESRAGSTETNIGWTIGPYSFSVSDRGAELSFILRAKLIVRRTEILYRRTHLVKLVWTDVWAVGEAKVNEVPFPKPLAFAFAIGNVGISFILISLVLSRPLAHPPSGELIIGSSTSPEDYTTLFGWITFSWVSPLIRIGTAKTLQEDDVWMMSKTMQAKPVFSRFEEIKGSLISRLWIANGRDLM